MSAKPGNGLSKDGLTTRDCFYAVYCGRGPVACSTPEAEVLTDGRCIGRKLCVMFSLDGTPKGTKKP